MPQPTGAEELARADAIFKRLPELRPADDEEEEENRKP